MINNKNFEHKLHGSPLSSSTYIFFQIITRLELSPIARKLLKID